MSNLETSLEIFKVVIVNETFDGLNIDNKTEKILEIFMKIHNRIQEIDSSSVKQKTSSSRIEDDSDKDGENRDHPPTGSASSGKTQNKTTDSGKNGDNRDDSGKNGDNKDDPSNSSPSSGKRDKKNKPTNSDKDGEQK